MPFGRYAESSAFAERALARHGGPQATDLNNPNQRVNMSDLQNKTVAQLREIARSHRPEGVSGTDIVHANKEKLVEWLSSTSEQESFYSEDELASEQASEQSSASEQEQAQESSEREYRRHWLSAKEQQEEEAVSVDPLAQAIAKAVQPFMEQKLDEEQVKDLIEQHASSPEPKEIEIKQAGETVAVIENQHYKFELLLKVCSAHVNVLLVGPAGTGKTHAGSSVAEALNLSFDALSVGPMTSKADLLGYQDATGNYHNTALVRQAVNGGVLLFDEIDAGHAGVLTTANAVLANGHFGTPIGMQNKHDDFIMLAAANTFGTGADRQYVGRNQLDAATLDRFAVIEWSYDESLEAMRCGVSGQSAPEFKIDHGGLVSRQDWYERALKVRHACEKLQLRHVIGRAVYHGCVLAEQGIGLAHLDEMLLWRGLANDQIQKVCSEAGITQIGA